MDKGSRALSLSQDKYSELRTGIISCTSSSHKYGGGSLQAPHKGQTEHSPYIGALQHVAGACVLIHLARALIKIGVTHLIVIHADGSTLILEEMEKFRQETQLSIQLDVVNAHEALNLEKTQSISYCRGILAAQKILRNADDPFLLVSSDHLYSTSLLRKMVHRLDAMQGSTRTIKSSSRQQNQMGSSLKNQQLYSTTVVEPVKLACVVLVDDSSSIFQKAAPLCYRLVYEERTMELQSVVRMQGDSVSNFTKNLTTEATENDFMRGEDGIYNAVDTGCFVFSSAFWTIAEKLDEEGYFSIADVLTRMIGEKKIDEDYPAVICESTNNLAWFTTEDHQDGARLVQMVEGGGWLSGRSEEKENPDELIEEEVDDHVMEFLERKSKLAKFENSLQGIQLPVSFFYTSDIRSILWNNLLTLTREAIEDLKLTEMTKQEPSSSSESGSGDAQSRRNDTNCQEHKRLTKVRIIWRLCRSVQEFFAFPTHMTLIHMESLLEIAKLHKFLAIAVACSASIGRHEMGPNLSELLKKVEEDKLITGTSNFYSLTNALSNTMAKNEKQKMYFEVLLVGKMTEVEQQGFSITLREKQSLSDEFEYAFVFVDSFEDAITTCLFNRMLQAVVITDCFTFESQNALNDIQCFISLREAAKLKKLLQTSSNVQLEKIKLLTAKIKALLPSLDIFWLSSESSIGYEGSTFPDHAHMGCPLTNRWFSDMDVLPARVFHDVASDATELHFSIIQAIAAKYHTPFFQALQDYASKPTGVFHALPLSRGNSIFHSHWLKDFGDFYGEKLFLAETSATIGGLDSLLEPKGVIREAQIRAAKAFGADHTYFSTNGTSTANKIVLQALLSPGDIILVDRNCHKSHHYGAVLQGAQVCYLDAYKMQEYAIYGTVTLKSIETALLWYKAQELLHKVKVILLTNCTFDGLVYNVRRVMEHCLAIKPDLVFLWDEAWFAFARFTPTFRRRTAMHCASHLKAKYRTDTYAHEYREHITQYKNGNIPQIILPDPAKVRIRVYSTQSTHKTLSALRQGSMIHVIDEDFRSKVEQAFHEAYMTHTSTSPNYQIIASLDCARRQVEMEGFALVQKSVEKAMMLRTNAQEHPLMRKFFKFLDIEDMIPPQLRDKGTPLTSSAQNGFTGLDESWAVDEVALDPTRLTLLVRQTGFDGDSFKKMLMNDYGIQVNKTSINTVLFMTNIGTTQSAVSHLSNSLLKIAHTLETKRNEQNVFERVLHYKLIKKQLPPLPDFSHFHPKFVTQEFNNIIRKGPMTREVPGNLRSAYFLGTNGDNVEYMLWEEIRSNIASGKSVVGATFIIPYPPGFPVVVPGQEITLQIVDFMEALDVSEVHGFSDGVGVRVFKTEVLRLDPAIVQRCCDAVIDDVEPCTDFSDTRGPSGVASLESDGGLNEETF